jgi:phenylalanyl-tRNA synthetase beta chain
MKISYNWLQQYLKINLPASEVSSILTSIGLEVEDVISYESLKGGLKGVVVGQVLTCDRHPNADKLSLTTVNIGAENPLKIVCGAPNVAAGQKVLVATIGTTIYPTSGEALTMKKAKIRGEESEGMICAEDELGLGTSHAGILILPETTAIGSSAADVLGIYNDTIFEIGSTPNRSDAFSHLGVAREVMDYLAVHQPND